MAEQGFTLTSPAFRTDEPMPPSLTCDGANKSPELDWMHPPQGTRSYALIVDDPDAPNGTFTHWVLFNIPADVQKIPADADNVGVSGRNDFQQDGYGGPCPPPNHGEHRYLLQAVRVGCGLTGRPARIPTPRSRASHAGTRSWSSATDGPVRTHSRLSSRGMAAR